MVEKSRTFLDQISESKRGAWLFLAALSSIYYLGLGQVHLFDWDEINFAECAREMIASGNYFRVQIDFIPFWEKTPFFFWLQVIAMKIFGVGEFAARLPNAVFGTLTLWTLYHIGAKHSGRKFGLVWALVYFASLLPHLYFKSGIIDPIFNYFIFLSVYFVIRAFSPQEKQSKMALLAGLFSALSVLTKGPVGFLLLFLTVGIYVLIQRFKLWPRLKDVGLFALAFVVIAGGWFAIDMAQNGTEVLSKFIQYQIDLFTTPVAGHEQPFYYHFVVVLLGCFPMSVFAIPAFWMKKHSPMDVRLWMKALFWVVMILFSIVSTKIVHYSSMTYLPLSFLAADVLLHYEFLSARMKTFMRALFLCIGLPLALLILALPFVPVFKAQLLPYIHEPFALSALALPVYWSGFELAIGLPLLLAVVGAFVWIKIDQWEKSLWALASGMALTLLLTLYVTLPKIETYSQGTAISFYKNLRGQEVYVSPYGFKSYAHFFYFELPPGADIRRQDMDFLLHGAIDKPAYFVTKINNHDLDNQDQLQLIESKGGFKFYLRTP